MDIRVKELVDFTREKWGLENYYLHTHQFYRKINFFNETIYTLTMEWFPSHITEQEDEDYNPDGTAVIDLNVNTRQFESVIFVGSKTYSERNVFQSLTANDIITWIEKETGLIYKQQFHLKKEEDRQFHFRGSVNGVAVSPSGTIEIQFDHEGRLTFFSVLGPFPAKESVEEEEFTLTLNDVESLAKEQLKLVELPLYKKKQFISIYTIEEIYVSNDQSTVIDFEDVRGKLQLNEILYWEAAAKKSFRRKPIDRIEDISAEQAFSGEPHPDLLPITEAEKTKCLLAVKDFMSCVYPTDSGKWMVKSLHRDNGFIFARLKKRNQEISVFQRKLQVIINRKTFKALNYMDSESLLDMFEGFEEAGSIQIDKDTAYEAIKGMIELRPVYVYDSRQNNYILCGKIDSDSGINATNGEVVELNEL